MPPSGEELAAIRNKAYEPGYQEAIKNILQQNGLDMSTMSEDIQGQSDGSETPV